MTQEILDTLRAVFDAMRETGSLRRSISNRTTTGLFQVSLARNLEATLA